MGLDGWCFSTAVNGIAVNSVFWHRSAAGKQPLSARSCLLLQRAFTQNGHSATVVSVLFWPGCIVTKQERGRLEDKHEHERKLTYAPTYARSVVCTVYKHSRPYVFKRVWKFTIEIKEGESGFIFSKTLMQHFFQSSHTCMNIPSCTLSSYHTQPWWNPPPIPPVVPILYLEQLRFVCIFSWILYAGYFPPHSVLERNKCISGYSYKPSSEQENDTERKIAGIACGKQSRHGLTADSELSFPLLFHLNKQGGWPDRARRGGAGWGGGGVVGGGWGGVRGSGWGGVHRDWNITKERGEEEGEGEDKRTTWRWKACRLLCWERQRHPPILTLPFHHNNSSGKWPPSVL